MRRTPAPVIRLVLPILIALTATATAAAQMPSDLIYGDSVDAIVQIAAGWGSASRDVDSYGDPMVRGRINGIGYSIYFYGCSEKGIECSSIQFYAGFLDYTGGLERLNQWNLDNRFGKAYLFNDGTVGVSLNVNLDGGVTRANLDDTFGFWDLVIRDFPDFIWEEGE